MSTPPHSRRPSRRLPQVLRALPGRVGRDRRDRRAVQGDVPVVAPAAVPPGPQVDIDPEDPVLAHFASARGSVDLGELELDSPAVRALRAAGMTLVVPLVAQGELIGLLSLGPRLSEQDYSREDRKLLDDLAGYAAPAVRVAQLVRQQEAEVAERSRIEQELRVANLIQQQFLPKQLPSLDGWAIDAYYRPAREVGGDFYDFIDLPGDRIGIVVGDVTDKGVPAALIMAKTHSILRSDAPRLVDPGAVLARANDLLVAEMPANMFVTCFYAVLHPATGHLRYANAGHPLPYVGADGASGELRARGMPLGLMPDMAYEEAETVVEPGQEVLLHSDGVAEAHGPGRELFGFPRLAGLVGRHAGDGLIEDVLLALRGFTGAGAEQEDDITLLSVRRTAQPSAPTAPGPVGEQVLADFEVPSALGNERVAMDEVATAVAGLDLEPARLERLKTAVSEATMNAIEHGNGADPALGVAVRLVATPDALRVRITDHGAGPADDEVAEPDIEAKLSGDQSPRGWGTFLIRSMVDELHESTDDASHALEFILHHDDRRAAGTHHGGADGDPTG